MARPANPLALQACAFYMGNDMAEVDDRIVLLLLGEVGTGKSTFARLVTQEPSIEIGHGLGQGTENPFPSKSLLSLVPERPDRLQEQARSLHTDFDSRDGPVSSWILRA